MTRLPEFEDSESAAYVFGPENGSRDETIPERRTHVVPIPDHECSNLAVLVSQGSRTARHQAGNGRNRSSASSGAGIAVASGSGRRAEYHGWHVGGRERNAGGEDRPHPVFQPSNGGVTHPIDSPATNQGRYRQPDHAGVGPSPLVDVERPRAQFRRARFEEAQTVEAVDARPSVQISAVSAAIDLVDRLVAVHERPQALDGPTSVGANTALQNDSSHAGYNLDCANK